MNKVTIFREYTRKLERKFANINSEKCCCGDSISKLQCFIIVEIGRQPGISLKELACKVEADKSFVSREIDELVKKEFVERTQSKQDRRKIVLKLLDKGEKRFTNIENSMNEKFLRILQEIPEEQQDNVINALKLYIDACSSLESKQNN